MACIESCGRVHTAQRQILLSVGSTSILSVSVQVSFSIGVSTQLPLCLQRLVYTNQTHDHGVKTVMFIFNCHGLLKQ